MSMPDRAEISRRNGQKSMGPKTVEGKNRSRPNALKHGMTATLPVMPGEDGEVLQGRIDAWTDDLQPRSLLESHFIEQAAQISWQLERIGRAQVARLTTNILTAEVEEVVLTGGVSRGVADEISDIEMLGVTTTRLDLEECFEDARLVGLVNIDYAGRAGNGGLARVRLPRRRPERNHLVAAPIRGSVCLRCPFR